MKAQFVRISASEENYTIAESTGGSLEGRGWKTSIWKLHTRDGWREFYNNHVLVVGENAVLPNVVMYDHEGGRVGSDQFKGWSIVPITELEVEEIVADLGDVEDFDGSEPPKFIETSSGTVVMWECDYSLMGNRLHFEIDLVPVEEKNYTAATLKGSKNPHIMSDPKVKKLVEEGTRGVFVNGFYNGRSGENAKFCLAPDTWFIDKSQGNGYEPSTVTFDPYLSQVYLVTDTEVKKVSIRELESWETIRLHSLENKKIRVKTKQNGRIVLSPRDKEIDWSSFKNYLKVLLDENKLFYEEVENNRLSIRAKKLPKIVERALTQSCYF